MANLSRSGIVFFRRKELACLGLGIQMLCEQLCEFQVQYLNSRLDHITWPLCYHSRVIFGAIYKVSNNLCKSSFFNISGRKTCEAFCFANSNPVKFMKKKYLFAMASQLA